MSGWWVNFMGREACTLMMLPSFATLFKKGVTQLSVTELLMSNNSMVFKPSLYGAYDRKLLCSKILTGQYCT
jgi:hypothetical protein